MSPLIMFPPIHDQPIMLVLKIQISNCTQNPNVKLYSKCKCQIVLKMQMSNCTQNANVKLYSKCKCQVVLKIYMPKLYLNPNSFPWHFQFFPLAFSNITPKTQMQCKIVCKCFFKLIYSMLHLYRSHVFKCLFFAPFKNHKKKGVSHKM